MQCILQIGCFGWMGWTRQDQASLGHRWRSTLHVASSQTSMVPLSIWESCHAELTWVLSGSSSGNEALSLSHLLYCGNLQAAWGYHRFLDTVSASGDRHWRLVYTGAAWGAVSSSTLWAVDSLSWLEAARYTAALWQLPTQKGEDHAHLTVRVWKPDRCSWASLSVASWVRFAPGQTILPDWKVILLLSREDWPQR